MSIFYKTDNGIIPVTGLLKNSEDYVTIDYSTTRQSELITFTQNKSYEIIADKHCRVWFSHYESSSGSSNIVARAIQVFKNEKRISVSESSSSYADYICGNTIDLNKGDVLRFWMHNIDASRPTLQLTYWIADYKA